MALCYATHHTHTDTLHGKLRPDGVSTYSVVIALDPDLSWNCSIITPILKYAMPNANDTKLRCDFNEKVKGSFSNLCHVKFHCHYLRWLNSLRSLSSTYLTLFSYAQSYKC